MSLTMRQKKKLIYEDIITMSSDSVCERYRISKRHLDRLVKEKYNMTITELQLDAGTYYSIKYGQRYYNAMLYYYDLDNFKSIKQRQVSREYNVSRTVIRNTMEYLRGRNEN